LRTADYAAVDICLHGVFYHELPHFTMVFPGKAGKKSGHFVNFMWCDRSIEQKAAVLSDGGKIAS
jgi:hypothetical protein